MGEHEKLSYDSDTGIYTIVLSTKSVYDTPEHKGAQGMYYGAGGAYAPKDYNGFLPGDMSGTLTLQAPKSTEGNTYEAYVILGNTNFDSVKLSNLRISNANH